jgi:lipopolysaccharide/colanic/teichoic acid biosynthesis glycosyltransferase
MEPGARKERMESPHYGNGRAAPAVAAVRLAKARKLSAPPVGGWMARHDARVRGSRRFGPRLKEMEPSMPTLLRPHPTPRYVPRPVARMLPVYLRSVAGPTVGYLTAKRALDVVLSATMLILLAPLFLVVALLIKCTDRGPVFFRQKRIGLNGREFDFFKFRSMVINADALKGELLKQNKHNNSITFKMCRDPRVTWIGRILRKTSIDELPQLWNVLKGEMTLVGPRPAVPIEVVKYTAHQRRRLGAVPGLTCIWQVSGRADLDFQQQVDLDLRYIRERSFWLELKLMVLTIPAVLSGKGAY